MKLVTLATCNLAQWALDFEGNLDRIKQSIIVAKQKGARYRLGPELEVSGYGCEDHFLEGDTFLHSWQCIAELLTSDLTDDILCDIGMPVFHHNVRYNCRVFLLNRKIVMIRPKLALADDGNYREARWFTAWQHRFQVEEYYLPRIVRSITGQTTVPIGDCCIALDDTALAPETCEELFTPNAPHIPLSLDGIEIITNGSGSHHQLRKLNTRVELMRSATSKCGGIYLYANHQCCDGGRLYFDGCAMILINGKVVAQGSQFSIHEVEVVTATVNLEDVRQYRGGMASRGIQAASAHKIQRIPCSFALTTRSVIQKPTPPVEPKYHLPEEEIALGPACWMWDYLRRSGLSGFFLPLSGGADSAATATIIGIMCNLLFKEYTAGNQQVITDVRRVGNYQKGEAPVSAKDLCSRIFVTCYMATRHSSSETRGNAQRLAEEIGARHIFIQIDPIVEGITKVFQTQEPQPLNINPSFQGSLTENLALQNIQARSRMVLSYFMAQLSLWSQNRLGSLLVVGSANVAEALRGYFTKYDCSSADINPIGGISKLDLRNFLLWASSDAPLSPQYKTLHSIAHATPTAELTPVTDGNIQKDEDDMKMTYAELERYGKLRKVEFCGPISMFSKLVSEWPHLEPKEVAEKVKRFFYYYSINRHKLTTLTPSYHAENYSPDDNRFDLRPFLYNSKWTYQFKKIDELVGMMEEEMGVKREKGKEQSVEDLEKELREAQLKVEMLQVRLAAKKSPSPGLPPQGEVPKSGVVAATVAEGKGQPEGSPKVEVAVAGVKGQVEGSPVPEVKGQPESDPTIAAPTTATQQTPEVKGQPESNPTTAAPTTATQQTSPRPSNQKPKPTPPSKPTPGGQKKYTPKKK
eukprot:TRINITY_DN3064_c0_g1_i3.p1 TRINITY_DN3064_c0_g1~~TRINITY_DN3064_c0_g1_i3.p1  ORF type:complete len:865 (-),score=231.12 TRINITY_DN3064_c0_g1_i3:2-2596(-)